MEPDSARPDGPEAGAEITKREAAWLALEDADLLDLVINSDEALEEARRVLRERTEQVGLMKSELVRRMKAIGAKILPHRDYAVEIKRTDVVDVHGPELERDLMELVAAGKVLEEDVRRVVYWTEPKPELKVDRRVAGMNKLKKYGEPVLAILAKHILIYPGDESLDIKAKKKPPQAEKNVTLSADAATAEFTYEGVEEEGTEGNG